MTKARVANAATTLENLLAVAALALISAIPIVEFAGREFRGRGLSGAIPIVQQLTLWITFLGAALAARSDRLLSMATQSFLPGPIRNALRVFTSAVAAGVSAWLASASLDLMWVQRESGETVAWGIPLWVAVSVMPAGFALIAARIVWMSSPRSRDRALALAGAFWPLLFESGLDLSGWTPHVPALAVLIAATALGMPIFAAIGGAAVLMFWSEGFGAVSVPLKVYHLSASPLLPAIPLFTLSGYILAEGQASQRLMRAFTALFGWAPGGLAIVITLMLAFFTTLGSGVTILSLGGLILPLMVKAGYSEKSSIGLVTVGGSTGLLFPPSLPVILYGIYAQTAIDKLFIGGLIPGAMLVAVVGGWGALEGHRAGAPRQQFAWREAIASMWNAKWDLLTPVLVVIGMFGGFATLVEAAALTVLYALVVECVIYRELKLFKDVPRVAVECATMIGGFLIILGVAMGFTDYLIQAEIPTKILEWVHNEISSPAVFLLALNLFLIVVGAVTDIYSAILVVVPLIVPISKAYGIDPTHLGVIFLTNMELGYLMPPMGENLFLSSLRFKQPLSRIYISTLPYLVLILVVVLLVTYVPALTLAPVGWFR